MSALQTYTMKNLIDGSNYDQFLMFVHSKAKLGILVWSLEDDYVQCRFDVQRTVQWTLNYYQKCFMNEFLVVGYQTFFEKWKIHVQFLFEVWLSNDEHICVCWMFEK